MTETTKSKFKIIPRNNWVLIEPVDIQKETASGLVIPESVEKEQKAMGTIVRLGAKVTHLEVGQRVLYGMYAGEDIQLRNKEEQKDQVDLKLVLEEDILAVIENEG
jgi:co-chaperonin GroES (HSP10)